jgi:zinc protease
MTTESDEPRLEQTEIDGIPVLWSPVPGPLRGGLVFRTGIADETAVVHGFTHLIEHLSLSALGRPAHQLNGSVDLLRTSFVTSGTPAEVASFFTALSGTLADLPTDRLETEVRILRTEAAGRGTWPSGPALLYRYGAGAHGLGGIDEIGLSRAAPESVREWAAARFTAGNAVLWLTGEPPEGLGLALPPGPRLAPPVAQPLDNRYPSWVTQKGPGVAIAMVFKRNTASSAFRLLLSHKALDRLRFEHGLSYTVAAVDDALDTEQVHAVVFADCLNEHVPRVHDLLLATVRDMAAGAATADDVRQYIEQWQLYATAPEALPGWLDRESTRLLWGDEPRSRSTAAELIASVTAADVAEVARQAAASSLSLVPPGITVNYEDITEYPVWSTSRVAGRTLMPILTSPNDPTAGRRLTVGDMGVTVAIDDKRVATVRFAEAVALFSWNDGSRSLIGRDGVRLLVRPRVWHGGQAAVEVIDAAIPAALVVPMGDFEGDGPALPKPKGPAAAAVHWLRTRRTSWLVTLLVMGIVFAMGSIAAAVDPTTASTPPSSDQPGIGTYVLMGVGGALVAIAAAAVLVDRVLRKRRAARPH